MKISEYKKSSKKLSELTFEKIEEAYKYVEGKQDSSENDNEMALRYQFDQLRRDVSKNQFLTQAEKKNSVQKRKSIFPNIPTIVELTR